MHRNPKRPRRMPPTSWNDRSSLNLGLTSNCPKCVLRVLRTVLRVLGIRTILSSLGMVWCQKPLDPTSNRPPISSLFASLVPLSHTSTHQGRTRSHFLPLSPFNRFYLFILNYSCHLTKIASSRAELRIRPKWCQNARIDE